MYLRRHPYPVQSCASLLISQLPRVCLALQLVYHFGYGLRALVFSSAGSD